MKNLIVIFWSMIFCQVVGFLGGSLTSAGYNPKTTFIVSIIFGLFVSLLPNLMGTSKDTSAEKK